MDTNETHDGREGNSERSLEEQKWRIEVAFREREIALKEREQSNREASELNDRATSGWRSPLVIAIVAATLAGFSNVVLEAHRSNYAQGIEARKGLASALGEFTTQLGKGIQAVSWLVWKAGGPPEYFSFADFEHYEKQMQSIRPPLLTATLLLAAHDWPAYDRLAGLTSEFWNIDAMVGYAAEAYRETPTDAVQSFASISQRLDALYPRIAPEVSLALQH